MGKRRTKWIAVWAALWVTALLTAGNAAAAEDRLLVPGGSVIGIRVDCDGVLVAGISEGRTAGSPAFAAGLRAGDVITGVDGAEVDSLEDFRAALEKWTGGTVELQARREGRELRFSVTPETDEAGKAALGLWLRDGMTGLGTLTFYEPETGLYGALGHGVNDIDTGVLLPVRGGSVTKATVSGAVAGRSGKPGELLGSFDPTQTQGCVEINCGHGIFGKLDGGCELAAGETLPCAESDEVRTGPGVILAGVDGEVKEYAVSIERVYPDESSGRDLLLRITDPALLEKTGGIVQGMSGSPILQDGRIVGAVTHVLVNDPTRGYGIFIENMLEAAG